MKSRKFIHFSAAVLLVLVVGWFTFSIALAEGDRGSLLSLPVFLILAGTSLETIHFGNTGSGSSDVWSELSISG